MNVEISSAEAGRPATDFDAIFADLPPLDGAKYRELLENAPTSVLPAQVLARAFRQLVAAGSTKEADATLIRLVAHDRFDYLVIVRKMAGSYVASGNYSFDADDLVQETIHEIVRTLSTPRGSLAETAWVLFIRQRFADAWRNLYGRHGQKDPEGRVEAYVDEKTGEPFDPVEETDGSSAGWHVGCRESDVPWILEFIHRVIEKIPDPLIRYVAADQLGDDPSPISAGRSEGGKLPLTEQLGLHRSKISRALKAAKIRLAADLLRQDEKDIDVEWLKKFAEK